MKFTLAIATLVLAFNAAASPVPSAAGSSTLALRDASLSTAPANTVTSLVGRQDDGAAQPTDDGSDGNVDEDPTKHDGDDTQDDEDPTKDDDDQPADVVERREDDDDAPVDDEQPTDATDDDGEDDESAADELVERRDDDDEPTSDPQNDGGASKDDGQNAAGNGQDFNDPSDG